MVVRKWLVDGIKIHGLGYTDQPETAGSIIQILDGCIYRRMTTLVFGCGCNQGVGYGRLKSFIHFTTNRTLATGFTFSRVEIMKIIFSIILRILLKILFNNFRTFF